MKLLVVLALLQAPQALWQQGRRAEAIDAQARAVAERPTDVAARRLLVEWEIAVHHYERALEIALPLPADADPLRGRALYALARYAEALPLLSDANVDDALRKIDALEALGKFAESDAALERARTSASAQDPRMRVCDGRRLLRLGRSQEATRAFEEALAADRWNREARYGLGRALIAAGERERGLAVLAEHRKLVPLLDQVDFARQGLDLAPMHAPNWAALGDAERALGRADRALEAYARAVALAAACADLVPACLRQARMLDEDRRDADGAVRALAEAAARCPDARLFVRAGDVLRRTGRKSEAAEQYSRAARLRPGDVEIARRLESVKQ